MAQSPPLLVVRDLARRFGNRWAVARASFELAAGEAVMLTGPNGSGKTTLLRCIATALRAHQGSAELLGQDVWRHRRKVRHQITLLSHATRTYDDLTGRDNLVVWARLAGVSADPTASLAAVGLEDRPEPVRTYSAGMRRRLALAIALQQRPALFLLDEPFSALDPAGRQLVIDVACRLRDAGTGVMVATHMPAAAAAICARTLHLEAGQIVWRGASTEHPGIG
jgi:heme exporter protein A